jgi:hypothetical protein
VIPLGTEETVKIRVMGCLVGVLVLRAMHVSYAQDADLKRCLAAVGASDQKAFLTFDKELRLAMSGKDATQLAMLATYPMKVYADGGIISIDNARSLHLRAAELFPAAVRTLVSSTKIADIICTDSGLGYGHGVVWIGLQKQGSREQFAIQSANLPNSLDRSASGLTFVCRADTQRVAVDKRSDGTFRFRLWDQPHTISVTPDVELLSGVETSAGTGACRHRMWSFKNSKATYVVEEPGCFSDSDPPPKGIIGNMLTTLAGQETKLSWCY